jgi:hypothetical protein
MVAIKIEGCPKRIHFIMVNERVPHPRYGTRVPYFTQMRKSDPDCPCRQKIRKELQRHA